MAMAKIWSGYPRACGDRTSALFSVSRTTGLSPRLRGSVSALLAFCVTGRVIPAPAGIGVASCTPGRWSPGYPRACGDRGTGAVQPRQQPGLSPRLRGSVAYRYQLLAGRRVIPAPAGIGSMSPSSSWNVSGYPRACGDREAPTARKGGGGGLSPRLRGSGLAGQLPHGASRVIPAPAGIGRRVSVSRRCRAGYPRACGDRINSLELLRSMCGLSPRLRGSVAGAQELVRKDRVIPAPAGIGPQFPSPQCAIAGYPRACGDRVSSGSSSTIFDGLSPRLRGSGRKCRQQRRSRRVIPAPAGIGFTGSG
ncbi:MAG: hypothetical protein AWU55_1920 [Halomonadaceae bacterium T82-2]|nr:MAG: hypothetical protein AWU55_1920 [Halomonadaceae bacterium T82-2]